MAAKPYGVHPGPPGWTGRCASLCPLPLTNAGRAPWLRSGSQRQSGDGDSGTNGVWGQGLPGGGEAGRKGEGSSSEKRRLRPRSSLGLERKWHRGAGALGAGVGRWPRTPRRAGTGHPADIARLPPAQGALRAIGGQARSPRRPPGEGPWVQSSGSSRGGTSPPWRHPHLGLDGSLLRGCPAPCSTPGLAHGTPGASPPRSLDIAKRPPGGHTALPSQATPVFHGVLRRSLERAPSHLAACSQGVQHPAHTFHCV